MEPEDPRLTGADTNKSPVSTDAGGAEIPPGSTVDAATPRASKSGTKRSTVIIGGVAILAFGMLLGIGATRNSTGIPRATAATAGSRASTPPPTALPVPNSTSPGTWNPFRELRDMQLRMDQMFDDMTTQFRLEPRLSLFTDTPGYSLSVRVQDLKDHFEVRAHLPNAKASDVNVSLLDKQTLKVEVSNKATSTGNKKAADERVAEWGQYSQIVQLPAPVKSENTKIDQPNHELLIILPKA
jgi:HSP20 family molecular chaperone IbpA